MGEPQHFFALSVKQYANYSYIFVVVDGSGYAFFKIGSDHYKSGPGSPALQIEAGSTICPRSLVPFYSASHHAKKWTRLLRYTVP